MAHVNCVVHGPHSHIANMWTPRLCRCAGHGPWPVQMRFSKQHVQRGRLQPNCHR